MTTYFYEGFFQVQSIFTSMPKAERGTEVAFAAQLLEAGHCVALPTETVYGLAANALNPEAVARIFEIKQRPHFDPLILHIHNSRQLLELASYIPDTAIRLAREFWPGPLTLVLPRTPTVIDLVTSGLDTVALRMPSHPMLRQLLQRLSFPIAMPSANPFGYVSPTTAQHVMDQLGNKIPYVLDGGPCEIGLESTIVSFDEQDTPVLLRPGAITEEQLVQVVGKLKRPAQESNGSPLAPGQLKSHYAPRIPLQMWVREELEALPYDPEAGVLVFGPYLKQFPRPVQRNLSESGNLAEAAHNLFSFLRYLDTDAHKRLYAHYLPDTGLGVPINDRLKKAAGMG